ncbi:phosphatase PAP2 family protein [Streptomyces sp. ISL-99]|uniref:phosphatase PAP2 family protein n=1 Tax=Streptomyces sp. ISL-99 TaxID=2819193 RepID=UPI001BE51687|nr:phosphatase PAP2 family protein [Streptomyces sp. ISL-99]MBT2528988.1 phosphatase PAP2 family protein [Streptomyces sp. ISL-99]
MDSTELYRDITDFAHTTPSWVRHLAEVWTEAGLLLFGVLFAVTWWRARDGDSRAVALAVLAPLVTAVAYVASELLKSVVDEERPCRAVANAAASLVPCPPTGDWSFPSNHATIAGAAAVALAVAWRRLIVLTVPMALLMGLSRVFVGVHYPRDVVAGLLLGAAVTAVGVWALTRLTQALVASMRTSRLALAVWFAGPGPGLRP